jgi:hypothetical protein
MVRGMGAGFGAFIGLAYWFIASSADVSVAAPIAGAAAFLCLAPVLAVETDAARTPMHKFRLTKGTCRKVRCRRFEIR